MRDKSVEGWFKLLGLGAACTAGLFPGTTTLVRADCLISASCSRTDQLVVQTVPASPASPPTDPNRDRFLQPAPLLPPDAPANTPVIPDPSPEPAASPASTPSTQQILVNRIEVTGSTILGPADFNPIIQPIQGRSVTLEELRGVADAITQLYLDRGYITSRAVLVDQTITDGLVQIRAIEGGIERIDVEGTQRVDQNYIRSRIALGGLTPVSKDRLEDQLRLLRADPLFENVEASLRSGSQFGQSILTVRVTEANPLVINLSTDNYSPPSVGSERIGLGLAYRNVTGIGDQIAASYSRSLTGGANLYDFSYRVPLNPMNGTLQFRAAPSTYQITDPAFALFGIRGNTDLYELSYRQPLIRTPRQEFALSLGLTYQSSKTLFNPFGTGETAFLSGGSDPNGVTTTSVLKFGQDYVSRDSQGAWALRSQFSLGIGILGATIGGNPDGSFFSWLGQAQRVQVLNDDQLLIGLLDLQLSLDSLLPSQQFVIGGGQSVRGFRQNARSGDNGLRFSLEDRITVLRNESGGSLIQLAPFVDVGVVWNNGGNPNRLPSQTVLAGGGVGLLWEPLPCFGVRLDYAVPFINLSDRGNNAQDEAFYFSINYQP